MESASKKLHRGLKGFAGVFKKAEKAAIKIDVIEYIYVISLNIKFRF